MSASSSASRVRPSPPAAPAPRRRTPSASPTAITSANGLVDVAIAGASEAVINYGAMRAWQAMHVLSPEGCFPFAKKRNGTVLARGRRHPGAGRAGARQGARRQDPCRADGLRHDVRRARTWSTPTSRAPTRPCGWRSRTPSSRPPTSTISTPTARRPPSTTSTRRTPSRGCSATHANKLAISSTKSMHGHPLGAGGGIEAVACVKAMKENWVPPTIGLDEPDPECDLDYMPNVGTRARGQLTRCRTRSPSAASTRCSCSARRPLRPGALAFGAHPPRLFLLLALACARQRGPGLCRRRPCAMRGRGGSPAVPSRSSTRNRASSPAIRTAM